jgi:dihydroneopterin aldolase
MIKVALHGAEFFAYHGYYPEEQILGTRFIVDIETSFDPASNINDVMEHTLNYEQLYNIAQAAMQQPKKLIETVAQGIADEIKSDFAFVQRVLVRVKKLNPAINGTVACSFIEVTL